MAPRSVMICDDAPSYRRVLNLFFDGEPGWTVVAEAEDGHQAIERVGQHRPDLLLLDVSMPLLGGLEALARIRAASPDTVVVLVTGYLGSEIAERARAHDVAEIVDKGAGLAALRATLERCFGR